MICRWKIIDKFSISNKWLVYDFAETVDVDKYDESDGSSRRRGTKFTDIYRRITDKKFFRLSSYFIIIKSLFLGILPTPTKVITCDPLTDDL